MMSANSNTHPSASVMTDHGPILDARTRLRSPQQVREALQKSFVPSV